MLKLPSPVHLLLIVFVSFGPSQGVSASTGSCGGSSELKQWTAYIKGFLEGALLTDSTILAALESVEPEHSSFFLRAYRTRLGIGADSIVPSTFLARFCLPAAKNVEQLAGSLAEKLMKNDTASGSPDERLYAYLQADYPCGKP